MVLLAALAASPAAARDVAAGSTIFVGEENLNLTAMNGTPVATLVYYSTAAPATIGRTISVGDSGAFDLTAADVGTSVGMWYAFPAGAALEDPDAANGYVIVQAPDIEPDTEVAGTVSAGTLDIAANKDSVFRGNNFVVTVTGEPSTAYYLYVEDPGLPANECPWIPVGQVGVQLTNVIGGSPSQANVTTNAAGSRYVQFNTNQSTADRSYTIHVESRTDPSTYDEVKVRVEKGAVTATVSGTGVYYIGEEIVFSGTNTDSDTTYLFMTGPNLPTGGVKLSDPGASVVNGSAETFTCVAVETDDTWTYRWATASLNRTLEHGGYTIYALSEPRGKDSISGTQYDTVSIQLRPPTIMATASGTVVAKGDNLTISGYATGNPDNVYVWIFGKNYDVFQQPVAIEFYGAFEYTIGSGETANMSAGQYFVVVQHPASNGAGINANASGYIEGPGIAPLNLEALSAPEAADALMNALDSYYVDDIYANLTFTIGEPWILIGPIGDMAVGSTFAISGTTNLAAGTRLNVEVMPVELAPTNSAVAAGTAIVQRGDPVNTWSMSVDATDFEPGQYTVRVESIETETTMTMLFDVIEGHAAPSADNLTLVPGWNFVSVPRPLAAGNDTAAIFAAVDTGGRSALRYNTTAGQWAALAATDRIAPLEGFWIYSAGSAAVPLNFSTDLPIPPSERSLEKGWNTVGVTGTDPATARDTLYSVNGQWTTLIGFDAGAQAFETAVVNGGSGAYADNRSVYPGRGYWLYMTGPGTLCSLGA